LAAVGAAYAPWEVLKVAVTLPHCGGVATQKTGYG